jgi:hypothetical protein
VPAKIDLTGQTFNCLTAIRRVLKSTKDRKTQWLWRCICGNHRALPAYAVKNGYYKSCGCKARNRPRQIAGKVFFGWTVLERTEKPDYWKCQCVCGKIKEVLGNNLVRGMTTSCSCVSRRGENNSRYKRAKEKHGANYTPKSDPWYGQASGVHARCQGGKSKFGFSSRHELAVYLKQIAPSVCPVFGTPFVRGGMRGDSKWFGPSVDRIDNSKGYIRGNLQIISLLANTMKRDASPTQLRDFAEWVLRKYPESRLPADAGWSAGLLH